MRDQREVGCKLGCRTAVGLQIKPAIELAAADGGGELFAQGHLKKAQFFRAAEVQIEKAAIDAFQFKGDAGRAKIAFEGGIAGHAVDGHGWFYQLAVLYSAAAYHPK